MATLTRKADALPVLQAGGFALVEKRDAGHGIAHLFDADGAPVEAWQAAIVACLTKCRVTADLGDKRRWEIKA